MSFVEHSNDNRYHRHNKLIGRGKQKTVYLAYDSLTSTEVAWGKINLGSGGFKLFQEVHLQININLKMRHKHIVPLYDWWFGRDNTVNVVMELFVPGSLKKHLQMYHPISTHVIRDWSYQIATALQSIHANGVVHRDIKCDNIMINSNTGLVKLSDLGFANFVSALSSEVVGTPCYMAPEVFDGKYTHKSDVYSFGMLLLEMLTNEVPYAECKTMAQIYRKLSANDPPNCFKSLNPSELKRLIALCIGPAETRPSIDTVLKSPFYTNKYYLEEKVTGKS